MPRAVLAWMDGVPSLSLSQSHSPLAGASEHKTPGNSRGMHTLPILVERKKIFTAHVISLVILSCLFFLSHPQGINIFRQNLDFGVFPPLLSYLCINMT